VFQRGELLAEAASRVLVPALAAFAVLCLLAWVLVEGRPAGPLD
jgi:hypothetical protein